MFAKTTLASAVAVGLGVSAVGIGTAQADGVFFPVVVSSDTVTTIASVINTSPRGFDNGGTPTVTARNLHYRLYYKPDVNTDPCVEFNQFLPSSMNDLQTFDIGGVFGADTLGVLFNDPSINNNWKAPNRSFAMAETLGTVRGYLLVHNAEDAAGGAYDTTADDSLKGEAFIFEFGSGAAWGYQAYSRQADMLLDPTTDQTDYDFRFARSASPTQVAFMPFAEMTTAFFVTSVKQDMAPFPANNYGTKLTLETGATRGAMFDRDENLFSGTVEQRVVCTGRVNAKDLLSAAAFNNLQDGGWSDLKNAGYSAATVIPSDGAVVVKLEYNTAGTLNGEAIGGTFNNALLLRPAD